MVDGELKIPPTIEVCATGSYIYELIIWKYLAWSRIIIYLSSRQNDITLCSTHNWISRYITNICKSWYWPPIGRISIKSRCKRRRHVVKWQLRLCTNNSLQEQHLKLFASVRSLTQYTKTNLSLSNMPIVSQTPIHGKVDRNQNTHYSDWLGLLMYWSTPPYVVNIVES